jgi:pimeloyl-ACP methyl ester carboxylesterase
MSLGLLAVPVNAAETVETPEGLESPPVKEHVALSHTDAVVRIYQPEDSPRAIMVLGSGDGGWSPWEDVVAGWLRDAGVCVAGFDFREYAAKDYDCKTLCKDMATVAAHVAGRIGGESLPVIYGGWSMGASQAVAAASGTNRPAKLAGLLLMSADHRGRYGLRESDELGITPEGAGTFALSDFNKDMCGLRVAQFRGTADFMASTAWIQTLKSPHALYLVPGANHGFDGPDDSFREWLARLIS